jgi:hypothetical protein
MADLQYYWQQLIGGLTFVSNLTSSLLGGAQTLSGASPTDVAGPAQTNNNYRGLMLWLYVSAYNAGNGTAPTVGAKVQVKDPVNGQWADLPGATFAQQGTTGATLMTIWGGGNLAASANSTVLQVLPQTWRVITTHGGTFGSTTTITLDVSGCYIR